MKFSMKVFFIAVINTLTKSVLERKGFILA